MSKRKAGKTMIRPMRLLLSFVVGNVLCCSSALNGQSGAVRPRIQGPVEESSLTTLRGSVPLLARAEFDRGPAPSSTQLTHVRLVLSRSAEQESALAQYMAEQQDKSSANYQKWLTPEEFGTKYGPAESDIAAIVAWLESRGLRVETVSTGRTNIAFSGTVIQVEAAFHTSIHSFDANGEQFTSNVTDPRIPSALAGVVAGVASLNTIRPKPHHAGGTMGKFDPGLGRMVPTNSNVSGSAKPELTTGTVGNYVLYVVPGDAAVIYNTPNRAFNPNFVTGSTSYSGLGVTIGIGGQAVIKASTYMSYRSRFLGDSNPPIITNVDGATSTTDQDEAYIDTELAAGLAPGATIHFYTATVLDVAINAMVNDKNPVDIISLSYGACELTNTTAANAVINGWWQQAAAQGIAVTVSTGDSGSAGCDDPATATAASGGLAVSGYASTPYNIAVGGTDFDGLLTNFGTYVGTINQPASLFRTVKSYIPESTWNNSVLVDGKISANAPYLNKSGVSNIVAGGGGASSCSINTSTTTVGGTCTSGYLKPAWQRGPQVPTDGVRDLPDVSLMSGNGLDAAAWLICTDNTGPAGVGGVTVTADCTTQSDGQFYFGGYGGTSTAAPAFAGILAMVREKTGSKLGQAAKDLYDLYNGSHAGAVFHDITAGNISVPCTVTTADCVKNGANSYFLSGYDAGTGYDQATGLGSVDATALVTYWTAATGTGAATLTVTPSLTTVAVNQSLSVAVNVTGSGATPTGTVTLASGGYSSPAQTLAGGSYTFTIPAGSLTKGADTLTVTYSGDAAYATKTGTASVTVTALNPTVSVSPAATSLYANVALIVSGTVSGSGATPTGTVTLSGGGYTSTAQTLSSGAYSITIPANSLSIGSDTMTVNYGGDGTYSTASNSATVMVMKGTFTLSATDVSFVAGATSGTNSTVTVTPVGGYTGTITLTAAITSSPVGSTLPPTLTGGTVTIAGSATGTGTIAIGTTARSARTRAALAKGGRWFGAAGGTAIAALLFFFMPVGSRRFRRLLSMVLVAGVISFGAVGCKGFFDPPTTTTTTTKGTATVTVTPAKTTMAVTDTLSVAVSVAGTGATPTGTVTLSSGSYSSAATTLASGSAAIVIPANSLASGADTLTVSYSGDTKFNTASGTALVTVNKTGTTAGAYTVTVTGTGNDAAVTTATTTFTLTVN